MKEALNLSHFAATQSCLGESPVWDITRQTLFYIDIPLGAIYALKLGHPAREIYRSARRVGALALTQAGSLIFTEDAQVALLELPSGRVIARSPLAYSDPSFRYNDGACCPQGSFVTGLMDERHSPHSGSLHRYGAGAERHILQRNLGLPNGIAWSADGETMYYVDSVVQVIYQAEWCGQNAQWLNSRFFARTPAGLGRPDGIALDVDGNLWVCQFDGGCILYYSRAGELLQKINLPVPRPTSCCFGGEELLTLYITSAKFGMSEDALLRYPLAGDMFKLQAPSAGLVPYRFDDRLWGACSL